jgi:NAD(P)H-hydrate epimerase
LYGAVIENLIDDFPRAAIVAVDVPTPGVEADITVSFTALKPCLVLPPDYENAGNVIVAEIGNPPELVESEEHKYNLIHPQDLPERAADTNKGTYGRVLIVGGSRGKSGAAAMAGQAALRSGAGLVTVATAAGILPVIAETMPELMTEPLAETTEGTIANQSISALLESKTVLGIGPGLTTVPETSAFVRRVVDEALIPIVIDADGLNAFAGFEKHLQGNGKSIIITPHPGEMARLIGKDTDYVVANRIDVAREFAVKHGVFVVLKGFRTVVALPDESIYINPTGNPGMATAGTGDILTGMLTGIVAQEHLGNFIDRICLAVYLHGLAGDLAAEEIGEEALVATDLLRFLPQAWDNLRS